LQGVRDFIVESLEERFETSGFEKADHYILGGNDGWAGAVGHRCTVDIVAIILI
jgi:hypothetical protein